jgi:hypothetical protein
MIGYEPEDDSELRYAQDVQRVLVDAGQGGRLG